MVDIKHYIYQQGISSRKIFIRMNIEVLKQVYELWIRIEFISQTMVILKILRN